MKKLLYPIMTEKAFDMVERDNKLVFAVDTRAKKEDVKKEVEGLYNVRVDKINTSITLKGEKKAYIKLKEEGAAGDVMAKLGLI